MEDSNSGLETEFDITDLYIWPCRPDEKVRETDTEVVILGDENLFRWLGGGDPAFFKISDSVRALGRVGASSSLEKDTKRDADATIGVHDVESLTVNVEGEFSMKGHSAVVENDWGNAMVN